MSGNWGRAKHAGSCPLYQLVRAHSCEQQWLEVHDLSRRHLRRQPAQVVRPASASCPSQEAVPSRWSRARYPANSSVCRRLPPADEPWRARCPDDLAGYVKTTFLSCLCVPQSACTDRALVTLLLEDLAQTPTRESPDSHAESPRRLRAAGRHESGASSVAESCVRR
jgi:hypothetical protein